MIYGFGDCAIDTTRFELSRDGRVSAVEPQVLELLIFLIERRERAVTRDELFESIWKGRIVSETTLSSRIKSARRAIGDDGARQQYIKTIHGRGFRFVGAVEVRDLAADAGPTNSGGIPATGSVGTGAAAAVRVMPAGAAAVQRPATRYARSGDVHVAYQLFGDGPVDFVLTPGFVSHIDNYWDDPRLAAWLTALGQRARVAMFDKRGTGMSDRVTALPGMDERMDDVRAVMDAAGFAKAFIIGVSEGGSLATLFAAHHPDRCEGLILYGAFAQFKYWFADDASLQGLFDYIESDWGSGNSLPAFAPSLADDPAYRAWWGRFERLGATPGAAIALMQMNSQIDIFDVLPSVHVPTLVIHRTGDLLIDVAAGRELGAQIPGARYVEMAGSDHLPWVGDADGVVAAIDAFVGHVERPAVPDRMLATLVLIRLDRSGGSSEKVGTIVAQEAGRFRATQREAMPDGIVVTFDGPTRALECAIAMARRFRGSGLPCRIGIHTGEVGTNTGVAGTLAVRIAADVCARAGSGQVWLSRTVSDLVAGSGVALDDRGRFRLPSLGDEWRLFEAVDRAS